MPKAGYDFRIESLGFDAVRALCSNVVLHASLGICRARWSFIRIYRNFIECSQVPEPRPCLQSKVPRLRVDNMKRKRAIEHEEASRICWSVRAATSNVPCLSCSQQSAAHLSWFSGCTLSLLPARACCWDPPYLSEDGIQNLKPQHFHPQMLNDKP